MGTAKHIRLKNSGHSTRSRVLKPGSDCPSPDKDAAVANLIQGLSLLMAHARRQDLGNAARILATAKEDLIYWAVDMNFHETAKDRFLNQQLNSGGGGELLTCLARLPADAQGSSSLDDFNALISRVTAVAARQYLAEIDRQTR